MKRQLKIRDNPDLHFIGQYYIIIPKWLVGTYTYYCIQYSPCFSCLINESYETSHTYVSIGVIKKYNNKICLFVTP